MTAVRPATLDDVPALTALNLERRAGVGSHLLEAVDAHRAAHGATEVEAGLTRGFAANAGGNRPMLAVNEWLGYRQVAEHTVVSRSLRIS